MSAAVVDALEIEKKINAFAELVGEEHFNLVVGGQFIRKEQQEERQKRDHSFTVPLGDLFTIASKLNERQALAKEVYQKEKSEGKSDAEAMQVVTAVSKVADELEEADAKVEEKRLEVASRLRQRVTADSAEIRGQTIGMDDEQFLDFMFAYTLQHDEEDAAVQELIKETNAFAAEQQRIYRRAKSNLAMMSWFGRASAYARAARDVADECLQEFRADPVGRTVDTTLNTLEFAGDLLLPGGVEAPAQYLRGEITGEEAIQAYGIALGTDLTTATVAKKLKLAQKVGKLCNGIGNKLQAAAVEKIAPKRTVGQVGRYGDLINKAPRGGFQDNMQAHHIPSDAFMRKYGVSRSDGLAIMLTKEQHKLTRTYGGRKISTLNPRSELAADLWDLREILRREGMYTPEINSNLMKGTAAFRQRFPEIFKKVERK